MSSQIKMQVRGVMLIGVMGRKRTGWETETQMRQSGGKYQTARKSSNGDI